MLRITTWRMNGTPQANVTPQAAFQTIHDMCGALEKVPGARNIRWFIGSQGIVTVGEIENYAVADSILKSSAAQTAVAKVLALGYGIVDDQFLLDSSQVLPFTQASEAVPAGLSRN
jgi:hypothetical protein